ncbi:MAG: hypothetical protein K2G91_07320, partial [Prevotella sp.]|nr:hypothetical protein [Prevotella sp.]
VLDAVKIDSQDIREAKTAKVALAGSTEEMKAVVKDAKPAFEGVAAPVKQISVSGEFVLAPEKAEIMKKIAAKAPAALGERYIAKAAVYKKADQKWYWSNPYIMETFSFGEGADYMQDIIPDNFSGYGVPALYTSEDKGDGTTAITVAPQWMGTMQGLDIFILDYTDLANGGDGAVKMTLAADGNITFDNPGHIVGYFATPAEEGYDIFTQGEPPFVPENIVGVVEQCQQVTYTLPEPDTFVAEKDYTGKGFDPDTKESVEWTMQLGTKDGNVAVIRNIVPSVERYTTLYVPTDLEYTLNGNTITIQPQYVGTSVNGYHLFVLNPYEADGSITLTKDAEDHIITPDNLELWVGAFTSTEFDPSAMAGYWTKTQKIQYYAEGQEIPKLAPEVMYEPENLILHVGISEKGSMYNNTFIILPGYTEIPYINTTADEVTSWSWEVCDSIYDAETKTYSAGTPATATGKNFSFMTEGSAVFGTPVLTGANDELVSTPYTWGTGENSNGTTRLAYQTVGDYIGSYTSTTGGQFTATACNPAFSIAYYSSLATPDINATRNITTIYVYQGKPVAPLFFTGLNLAVKDFTAQSDFSLTARIVKAKRSASGGVIFGETIAYADATAESVTNDAAFSLINFNDMYVLDEDEMSQTIDHLFIDEEFAVVFDGWNNGTFSCSPYGEYESNGNGFTNIYFEKAEAPGEHYYFQNNYSRLCVGFNDAAYGYLHTTSATNFTALAAGEEFTISVDDAMLHSVNEAGESSARVFASDDCPEWITLSVANVNEKATAFDIKVTVEKNEGAAREAKFYIYQEGAKIDVTVSQTGDSDVNTGINGVNADKASAPRYNAAGQRVNTNAKGIVISNGKKQIAK